MRLRPSRRRREDGLMSLILFVLLVIMGSIAVSSGYVLVHLRKELRLIEGMQMKQHAIQDPENRNPEKAPGAEPVEAHEGFGRAVSIHPQLEPPPVA